MSRLSARSASRVRPSSFSACGPPTGRGEGRRRTQQSWAQQRGPRPRQWHRPAARVATRARRAIRPPPPASPRPCAPPCAAPRRPKPRLPQVEPRLAHVWHQLDRALVRRDALADVTHRHSAQAQHVPGLARRAGNRGGRSGGTCMFLCGAEGRRAAPAQAPATLRRASALTSASTPPFRPACHLGVAVVQFGGAFKVARAAAVVLVLLLQRAALKQHLGARRHAASTGGTGAGSQCGLAAGG